MERVRLETEKVTETREVSDTVRKEKIEYENPKDDGGMPGEGKFGRKAAPLTGSHIEDWAPVTRPGPSRERGHPHVPATPHRGRPSASSASHNQLWPQASVQ